MVATRRTDFRERTAYTAGLMRGAIGRAVALLEQHQTERAAVYLRYMREYVDQIMNGETDVPEESEPYPDPTTIQGKRK